jgi:hypothetical protein
MLIKNLDDTLSNGTMGIVESFSTLNDFAFTYGDIKPGLDTNTTTAETSALRGYRPSVIMPDI